MQFLSAPARIGLPHHMSLSRQPSTRIEADNARKICDILWSANELDLDCSSVIDGIMKDNNVPNVSIKFGRREEKEEKDTLISYGGEYKCDTSLFCDVFMSRLKSLASSAVDEFAKVLPSTSNGAVQDRGKDTIDHGDRDRGDQIGQSGQNREKGRERERTRARSRSKGPTNTAPGSLSHSAFPPLPSSTSANSSNSATKIAKKRITPVLLSTSSSSTPSFASSSRPTQAQSRPSAWASSSSSSLRFGVGSGTGGKTSANMGMGMDMMSSSFRFGGNLKGVVKKEEEEGKEKELTQEEDTIIGAHDSPLNRCIDVSSTDRSVNVSESLSDVNVKIVEEKEKEKEEKLELNANDKVVLDRIAMIHSEILNNGRIVVIMDELLLLIQLLCIDDHDVSSSSSTAAIPFFKSAEGCHIYASHVLLGSQGIVRALGRKIAEKLSKNPSILEYTPSLAVSLSQDLKTVWKEEVSLSLSLAMPLEEKNESHYLTNFNTVIDARHSWLQPAESALFNNREKCRDEYSRLWSGFTGFSFSMGNSGKSTFWDNAREFFSHVNRQNVPWLAQFIVEQLRQNCIETPDSRKWNEVWSRRPQNSTQSHSHSHSHSHAGNANAGRHRKARPSTQHTPAHSRGSVLDLEQYVPLLHNTASDFVFRIIAACDSHVLNAHLITVLTHTLTTLSTPLNLDLDLDSKHPHPHTVVDMDINSLTSKTLTKHVIETSEMARVLGYVLFYPRWSVYQQYQRQSAGPIAAARQFVEMSDSVKPQIDLLGILNDSVHHNYTILVVPWICSCLRMMERDEISRKTHYFQSLFLKLWTLSRSWFNCGGGGGGGGSMSIVEIYLSFMIDDTLGALNYVPVENGSRGQSDDEDEDEGWDSSDRMRLSSILTDDSFVIQCFPQLELLSNALELEKHSVSASTLHTKPIVKITPDSSSPSPSLSAAPTPTTSIDIQSQLSASLFTQNPSLKRAADHTLESAVKNSSARAIKRVLSRPGALHFDHENVKETDRISDLAKSIVQETQGNLISEAVQSARTMCEADILKILPMLCPHDIPAMALQEGLKLVIEHGLCSVEQIVRRDAPSLILRTVEERVSEVRRMVKKKRMTEHRNSISRNHQNHHPEASAAVPMQIKTKSGNDVCDNPTLNLDLNLNLDGAAAASASTSINGASDSNVNVPGNTAVFGLRRPKRIDTAANQINTLLSAGSSSSSSSSSSTPSDGKTELASDGDDSILKKLHFLLSGAYEEVTNDHFDFNPASLSHFIDSLVTATAYISSVWHVARSEAHCATLLRLIDLWCVVSEEELRRGNGVEHLRVVSTLLSVDWLMKLKARSCECECEYDFHSFGVIVACMIHHGVLNAVSVERVMINSVKSEQGEGGIRLSVLSAVLSGLCLAYHGDYETDIVLRYSSSSSASASGVDVGSSQRKRSRIPHRPHKLMLARLIALLLSLSPSLSPSQPQDLEDSQVLKLNEKTRSFLKKAKRCISLTCV